MSHKGERSLTGYREGLNQLFASPPEMTDYLIRKTISIKNGFKITGTPSALVDELLAAILRVRQG